jgi:hypothetical protein
MSNPKFSTPPAGSSTALSWFKRDLDQKADKAWVEAKLETLERDLTAIKDRGEDTKSIAIRAKEKATMSHACTQKETLSKIEDAVHGWSTWWRGILLSFIGVVATLGSSGAYQYFMFKDSISETKENISKLESVISKLETSQSEIKASLEKRTSYDEIRNEEQLKDIKAVILKALQESQKKAKQ